MRTLIFQTLVLMRVPTKPFDGSVGGVVCYIGSDGKSVLAPLPAALPELLPELPPVGRMGVGAIRSAGL